VVLAALCDSAVRGDSSESRVVTSPPMLHRLALLLLLSACAASHAAPPRNAATIPAEHTDAAARNAALVERARGSHAPLIFLGDSITEGWEVAGKAPWTEGLAPLGALDLGVGGDRTEHLLFRLRSGAYDTLPVRVAVILIGTNNLGTNQTPEMTADGVAAVLDDVLARWPSCQVLLLAIFPRGEKPDDPLRQLVERTNPLLREVADRDRVTWLDFGAQFLAPDGTLPKETMPDFLHLSESGYRTWLARVRPKLESLLR
jgi:beta-glucosidase